MAEVETRQPSSALASIVHQAGPDGKQANPPAPQSPSLQRTPVVPPRHRRPAETRPRPGFWSSLLCCVGAGSATKYDAPPTSDGTLLGPQRAELEGRKTLILDLDETLVHSSFRPVPNADYIIPVNIEGTVHHVYVIKRPCVDEFLERMGRLFEVVVFTASLSKYADPLLDQLDASKVVHGRLFREHCTQHQGNFVKDLALVGRDLNSTIIIDNSPASYMFHPKHAIGCTSFIDNMHDRELAFIADFLETLVDVDDVTKYTHLWNVSGGGNLPH